MLALVVAALAAMWVYALGFASKEYRLALKDDAWVARAEATCAASNQRIYALAPGTAFKDVQPLSEALRQRAAVLDQANAVVADEIATLRALGGPGNPRGATLVELWLADWDLYLDARQAQGANWRAGRDDPFTVPADDGGAPITEDMDAFATSNRMPSCVVPGDL